MFSSKKSRGMVSSSLVISAVAAPHTLQAQALDFEEIKDSFCSFFARTFYYWWYRKSFINRIDRLLNNGEKVKNGMVKSQKLKLESNKEIQYKIMHGALSSLERLVGSKSKLFLNTNNIKGEKSEIESYLEFLKKSAQEVRKELEPYKPVIDMYYANELLQHFRKVLRYQKEENAIRSSGTIYKIELEDLLKDNGDVLKVYEKERDRETFDEEGRKERETNLKTIINSLEKKVEDLSVEVQKLFKMENNCNLGSSLEETYDWVKEYKSNFRGDFVLLYDGDLNPKIDFIKKECEKCVKYEEEAESLDYDKLDSNLKKSYDSNYNFKLSQLKKELEKGSFYLSGKEDIISIEKNYLEPLEKLLLGQAE